MSEHILKSHNKSLLLYHIVCPIKYRRDVFTEAVSQTMRSVCQGLEERYEVHFLEIGLDGDHGHFLVQSVPLLSPKKIVNTLKSVTAKEIFRLHPEVKQKLWGGRFWTSGYYVNTVGQYANEEVIKKYIENQGKDIKEYKLIHKNQLTLF